MLAGDAVALTERREEPGRGQVLAEAVVVWVVGLLMALPVLLVGHRLLDGLALP